MNATEKTATYLDSSLTYRSHEKTSALAAFVTRTKLAEAVVDDTAEASGRGSGDAGPRASPPAGR